MSAFLDSGVDHDGMYAVRATAPDGGRTANRLERFFETMKTQEQPPGLLGSGRYRIVERCGSNAALRRMPDFLRLEQEMRAASSARFERCRDC